MRFRLAAVAALAAAVVAVLIAVVATPSSATTDTTRLSHITGVGVHNAYDKAKYAWFADALDSGAALLELDVWANPLLHRWQVGHDLFTNNNNCATASTAAQLRTGSRDQDFPTCLDNLRIWHAAHPDHRPVVIKVEMKYGFDGRAGMSAAALDELIASRLGSAVFRPADLLAKPDGGQYPTLDAAARADNWPARAALAGKFIFEIIPGTVEQKNPFDHLWTDLEYARYLRDLAATGQIGKAQFFPTVLGAAAGDPRTRYAEENVRPWFVFFDGAATTYVSGIDTSWYDTNHYFLVMDDAHQVAPALDQNRPDPAAAQARVAQMARAHASIVGTDWAALPDVLGSTVDRGAP